LKNAFFYLLFIFLQFVLALPCLEAGRIFMGWLQADDKLNQLSILKKNFEIKPVLTELWPFFEDDVI